MDDYQKYIEDRKFLKWVFDPDPETEKYYTGYLETHPGEKDEILQAKKELSLLAVRHRKPLSGKKEMIYYKIMNVLTERGQSQKGRPDTETGKPEEEQKNLSFAGRKERLLNREQDLSRSFRLRSVIFVRYAAVALLFFAVGSLLTDQFKADQVMFPVDESLLVKSAALNTMVYLSDGSQREIANTGTLIDFSCRGYLVAGADSVKIGATASANSKNLVVVPYGKRARIKLYDRSIINLNAGSRIILPDQFSSGTRNAYLMGEAFFDIVKDPEHPFFVETSSSTIKVLGTSFTICAYPDRNELTAYLQEGKIRFRLTDDSWFSGWHDLKPGEQFTLNKKTKNVMIARGNEWYYQLWKDGIMPFNEETVQDVLIRIGQYYNITLKADGDHHAAMRRIKGKLDLNTEMIEVFKYIENITDGKIIKINAGEFILK